MISAPKPAPREKKKPKRLAVRRDSLEKECDELWSDCIKLRAGFKSELSNQPAWNFNGEKVGGIVGHHIIKKPNLWLRYSLDNGICVTDYEHDEIHFEKSPKQFMDEAEQLAGPERFYRLLQLKHDTTKPSLVAVKEDLIFTRNVLIEKLKESGDTYLLNVFLKTLTEKG